MIDAQLQKLVDAPLADPLRINLPMGKRTAPRSAKPVYECEFAPEKLTGKQVRERAKAKQSDKLGTVLDYYAKTNVPVDRVAGHTKLTLAQAARSMDTLGRAPAYVWEQDRIGDWVCARVAGVPLHRVKHECDRAPKTAALIAAGPCVIVIIERWTTTDDETGDVTNHERQTLAHDGETA